MSDASAMPNELSCKCSSCAISSRVAFLCFVLSYGGCKGSLFCGRKETTFSSNPIHTVPPIKYIPPLSKQLLPVLTQDNRDSTVLE